MKPRTLFTFCLSMSLLAACSAPAAQQTQAPPVVDTPLAATMAPPTSTVTPEASPSVMEPSLPFDLISTAFEQGGPIPAKYSCNGEDISPSLAWGDPPAGTQSLALIMDDPDAPGGTWVHWVLFNISPDLRELQENLPITGKNQDPNAIFVGNNSWGRADYGGPCPPSGTHRYFFKLYALDTTISLLPGATKQELLSAMDGHILAEADLMGTFSH
jgi:Raf kinase inhibitor-like YbhB/YbcL family protein